jgi:hypothetical protein
MNSRFNVLCFLFIGGVLAAQTQPPVANSVPPASAPAPAAPSLNALTAACQMRADMVAGIVKGTEKPDAALARLKRLSSPMGFSIDPEAELGYAAIDIGHRLLSAGKPVEAEIFFKAAEQPLAAAVKKTPETQPRDKAQFLQQLALIRGRYLNNAVQAKADIEQAIVLQPKDEGLQQNRAQLARDHGRLFTGEKSKN